MTKRIFITSMLAVVAALFSFGLTGNTAHAQSMPPGPCPVYWINYNYVYPPAPSGTFTFNIICADGRTLPGTNETADGHYTYPADRSCQPIAIVVNYIDPFTGNPVSVQVPIPSGPVAINTPPWGVLRIESKFDSNGCLEVKVSY